MSHKPPRRWSARCRRDAVVTLRVSYLEREQLRARADLEGETVSDILRRLLQQLRITNTRSGD